MAKQPAPSREASVIAGLDAFNETVRERDELQAQVTSLMRDNTDLHGQNGALREIVQKMLEDRDLLTAALSAANTHLRNEHRAFADMAQETKKAVDSAKALENSGAEAMARRLAPPNPKLLQTTPLRASLADRIADAGQNGGAPK
jgi:hypothetical protein